jgi:hypothetical protein
MAKVILSGDVDEVKEYEGKTHFKLWETYTTPFGQSTRLWTVWLDVKLDDCHKGDWFELEGNLSTKVGSPYISKRDGLEKQGIDHNLNDVSIIKHNPIIPKAAPLMQDEDDMRKYGHETYGSHAPF